MKIFVSLILVFAFVNPIHAFWLNNVKVSDLQLSDIEMIQPVAVKAVKKSSQKNANEQVTLWMQIRGSGVENETEAVDSFSRIDVVVRKVSGNDYSVRTIVDANYEWGNARKESNNEYYLSGNGINLVMSKFRDGYLITGNIHEDNRNTYIDIALNKRFADDDFSYYVDDFRINLKIDARSIDGYFNTNDYSKKSVAAVISFILVLHDQKFNTEDRI